MTYKGYEVTTSFDEGVERDGKIVEGYYCEVYRANDNNYANMLDAFCLGVGYEIQDLDEDTLDAAIKQYIDENLLHLNEFCSSAEIDRYKMICVKAFDYIEKTTDFNELYNLLHDKFGLTDEEIDEFGYDFSDLEQETDDNFSIIHFHDYDDDFCISTYKSLDLYQIAEIYRKDMKYEVGRVTLDSLANDFPDSIMVDEKLYPVLCNSIENDDRIASIANFNLEDDVLDFRNSSDKNWRTFNLKDISYTADLIDEQKRISDSKKNELFCNLIAGKQINIDTDCEDTEQESSPTMQM